MEPFKFVESRPKREGTAILGIFSALLVKYEGHIMSQRDKETVRNTEVRVRRHDLSKSHLLLVVYFWQVTWIFFFFSAHLQKIGDYCLRQYRRSVLVSPTTLEPSFPS